MLIDVVLMWVLVIIELVDVVVNEGVGYYWVG